MISKKKPIVSLIPYCVPLENRTITAGTRVPNRTAEKELQKKLTLLSNIQLLFSIVSDAVFADLIEIALKEPASLRPWLFSHKPYRDTLTGFIFSG